MIITPIANRLHIVMIGEQNSGKSSLLNAITKQDVSIVSDVPGTTTDPVSKSMEVRGIGPCVFVDTAGIDDDAMLGALRVQKTRKYVAEADMAIIVIDATTGHLPAMEVKIPSVVVVNKTDLVWDETARQVASVAQKRYDMEPIMASAVTREGIEDIIHAIAAALPEDWDALPLTTDIAHEGDLVLLVMPQDTQAPKGRLILPQVQTLRELLDRKCRVMCCTTDLLPQTLASLASPPDAIITDSQDFMTVDTIKPAESRLTSFSILFAASKGDINYFRRSARAIDFLTPHSRVLIAEACTHVPAEEDIGRVKIPRLLRAKAGEGLQIDTVSGKDFPDDLSPYDLIIHCGACMFNRRLVLARVDEAKRQHVPMTNYGIAIAYVNGILI